VDENQKVINDVLAVDFKVTSSDIVVLLNMSHGTNSSNLRNV